MKDFSSLLNVRTETAKLRGVKVTIPEITIGTWERHEPRVTAAMQRGISGDYGAAVTHLARIGGELLLEKDAEGKPYNPGLEAKHVAALPMAETIEIARCVVKLIDWEDLAGKARAMWSDLEGLEKMLRDRLPDLFQPTSSEPSSSTDSQEPTDGP